jgi:hypothetical protein
MKRPSLEAIAREDMPKPIAPSAPRVRAPRADRPHVSVYISKAAQRVFKDIAHDYQIKVHDLYREGFDLVLRSYGKPSLAEIGENDLRPVPRRPVSTGPRDSGVT